MNVQIGDTVPPWTMESVEAARMRTMAAILRDPYQVHWDRAGNERLGFGARVINQGPLNLSYLVNMIHAWAGPGSVRRLTVAFARPVLDEDCVTARGTVLALADVGGERHATCEIWLDRDGEKVVTGTAVVAVA